MSGKTGKGADKKQADESGAVLAENVQERKNMLYEAEGKTGENKGKSLWKAERKMEGILLLGFGIAVFLTTSAACLLGCSPILRGKKR